VEKLKEKNHELTSTNTQLAISIGQLKEGLEQNEDKETDVIIEQLTNRLQKEKMFSKELQKKLEVANKDLIKSNKNCNEGIEKISALTLALGQHGVELPTEPLTPTHAPLRQSNLDLMALTQKYEIQLMQLNKENRTLQKEVKALKKTNQEVQL
jgi:hypothetical protein